MKVKINKNKCVGCGICAAMLPEIFTLKEGKVAFKDDEATEKVISDELKEKIEMIIERCPGKAIEVE